MSYFDAPIMKTQSIVSNEELIGIAEQCLQLSDVTEILKVAGFETFLTDQQQAIIDRHIDGMVKALGYEEPLSRVCRWAIVALLRRVLTGRFSGPRSPEALRFVARNNNSQDYKSNGSTMHVNEFVYLIEKLWPDKKLMRVVQKSIGANHDDDETKKAFRALDKALEKWVILHAFRNIRRGLMLRFFTHMLLGDFDSPLSDEGLKILRQHASYSSPSITFEGDSNV